MVCLLSFFNAMELMALYAESEANGTSQLKKRPLPSLEQGLPCTPDIVPPPVVRSWQLKGVSLEFHNLKRIVRGLPHSVNQSQSGYNCGKFNASLT
jgi:hypothetical protein